jgi:uncharacterized protein (TIGR00251 family)
LRVHAQPGARRTEITGLHGDALKVRVAAPALEDRANQALVDFLAATFEVPRRAVRLVAGVKAREKRFEISGSPVDPGSLVQDLP